MLAVVYRGRLVAPPQVAPRWAYLEMLPLVQNRLRLLSGFLLLIMMCLLRLIRSRCLLGGLQVARRCLVVVVLVAPAVVLMVVLGLRKALDHRITVVGVVGRPARLLQNVRQGAAVGRRPIDDMVVSLVRRRRRDHVDLVTCGAGPHLAERLPALRTRLVRSDRPVEVFLAAGP